MPRIPSPRDTSTTRQYPSLDTGYTHPASTRKGRFIPMAFQVTSPLNRRMALLPHALVLHTNPTTFSENPTKKIERFQTRGGFVEQHWGDELTEISGDSSTGAFMNLQTGTSSVNRQRTIAWDRYRDLLDLYYNNGSVYDPFGNIVLQGNLMLMYDKGTYIGYFTNFSVEETGDSPFTFNLSWTFKVEETILKLPYFRDGAGYTTPTKTPSFQGSPEIGYTNPVPQAPAADPIEPVGFSGWGVPDSNTVPMPTTTTQKAGDDRGLSIEIPTAATQKAEDARELENLRVSIEMGDASAAERARYKVLMERIAGF